MWKNVHPVYGAGIQTHNLQHMSPLLQPLDQGSHPVVDLKNHFCRKSRFLLKLKQQE